MEVKTGMAGVVGKEFFKGGVFLWSMVFERLFLVTFFVVFGKISFMGYDLYLLSVFF